MKTKLVYLFSLLLFCCIVTSCNKDEPTPQVSEEQAAKQQIIGSWNITGLSQLFFNSEGDTIFVKNDAPTGAPYVFTESTVTYGKLPPHAPYTITKADDNLVLSINWGGPQITEWQLELKQDGTMVWTRDTKFKEYFDQGQLQSAAKSDYKISLKKQ